MRMPSPRVLLAGAALTAAVATAATAFAAVTNPTPVLNNPGDEYAYRVSGTTSIWFQNTPATRNHYNAYIRTAAGLQKLNAAGTTGYGGGVDGTTVIYQQASNGVSHLFRYNVTTGTRTALAAGFNVPQAWEFSPTVSGNWVLFGRQYNTGNEAIVLRNLGSGLQYIFAQNDARTNSDSPGQVNGDWAVWSVCNKNGCSVYRFQISTHTTTKLINTLPPARFEYSPGVAADGTAYYLHAGAKCGDHVRLVMHGVGQPETVLRSFSQGIDGFDSFVTPNPTTGTDYYWARQVCSTGRSDIYKVTNS